MDPATHNIVIYRDRDYSQVYIFKTAAGAVINLAGYSAKAQIRPAKDSTALIKEFGATITSAEGKVTVTLADTETLVLDESKAWWDLVLTAPSGSRQNYVEGAVAIRGTVTRGA